VAHLLTWPTRVRGTLHTCTVLKVLTSKSCDDYMFDVAHAYAYIHVLYMYIEDE
jgi:hypothetical protein